MLSDETSSHKDIIVLRTHELYLFLKNLRFNFISSLLMYYFRNTLFILCVRYAVNSSAKINGPEVNFYHLIAGFKIPFPLQIIANRILSIGIYTKY